MTTPETTQLKNALVSSGWADYERDEPLRKLDAVLYRSYAVVGLIVVSNGRAAIEGWLAAQAELSEFRSNFGRNRDMYLLICVQEIEPDAMDDLPSIINDTHTCRKIVVEVRARSGEEALSDVPILFWRDGPDTQQDEETLPSAKLHIPDQVLDDLGKRGPGRILDALLQGVYEPGDES